MQQRVQYGFVVLEAPNGPKSKSEVVINDMAPAQVQCA